MQGVQFQRASNVLAPVKVFADGVEPDDIQQRGLGNCYFLATLSAMAEFPKNIENIFYTKEANAAGCYLVSIFVNGVPTPIIIDDYIPCRYGQPAFSTTKTKEIWAILLEKAYAKLQGTYARTEGGQTQVACAHMMGSPARNF